MANNLNLTSGSFGEEMKASDLATKTLEHLGKEGQRQSADIFNKKWKKHRQSLGIHSADQILRKDQMAKLLEKVEADTDLSGFVSGSKTRKFRQRLLEKSIVPEILPDKPLTTTNTQTIASINKPPTSVPKNPGFLSRLNNLFGGGNTRPSGGYRTLKQNSINNNLSKTPSVNSGVSKPNIILPKK